MPNFTEQLTLKFVDRELRLTRVAAGQSKKIGPILRTLARDIVTAIVDRDLSASKVNSLNAVLSDIQTLSSRAYSAIGAEMFQFAQGLIPLESSFVATVMNQTLGAGVVGGLSPTSVLNMLNGNDFMVLNAPSSEWWGAQSRSLIQTFTREVRAGIASGETTGAIITRLRGTEEYPSLMIPSYKQAEMLVRTSTASVAHNARLETFRTNKDVIKGVQQQSTLDSRTTTTCIAYDDQSWDLDGEPINGSKLPFNGGPPRHWGCRSILVPITKSWRELGSAIDIPGYEPATRASIDGEVAGKTTFQTWLDSRTTAEQDAQLGKGRAELYRAGKITLQELLDQRGRPLTLEQLRES